MLGLIGEKIGMTQVYAEDGSFIPVTVVSLRPNFVAAIRTPEKNGYQAVQLAAKEQKESRLSKPLKTQFKKANLNTASWVKEFLTDKVSNYTVGMQIGVGSFKIGDKIDVQGVSKGKGFQGVMKRHHFAGGRDSHGCSLSHRVPGSIGCRTYPGRVIPGKKMPGHMGDRTVTMKNLEVVGIKEEQGILLIKGAVPGANHAQVFIFPHAKEFEDRVLSAQGGKTEQAASAPAA